MGKNGVIEAISPDNNNWVVTNGNLTLNEQAKNISHEIGHALFYEYQQQGQKDINPWHDWERTVSGDLKNGFTIIDTDTNTKLVKFIKNAIEETERHISERAE